MQVWQTLRVLCLSALPMLGSTSGNADQTEIHVLSFKDGHALAVQSELEDFEKSTGIKVQMDLFPAGSVASKIMTDQAGRGVYDVYLVDEPYIPQLAPFLRPLDEWPNRTPDTAPTEFVNAALKASVFDGRAYGLPVNGNVYLPIYRKDLFENEVERSAFKSRYGRDLKLPLTASELLDVAQFFYRPPNLYGFAPFTKMSEGTTVEFLWLLSLLGHELINSDGVLEAQAADFAQAFSLYRKLLAFSPPGSRSWHHSERMRAYSRGQIAYMMTWPSFLRDLEDPAKSLVVGKTGYAISPVWTQQNGVLGSSVSGTWTIALSRKTRQVAAAAEFAYWWAGSRSGKLLVPRGMNPARRDLLSSASLIRENPWFPVVLENLEMARVRPRVKAYSKISHALSRAFTQAVAAESPLDQCSSCEKISKNLEHELSHLVGR